MGNFSENSLYQKQYAMSLGVAQIKYALYTFYIYIYIYFYYLIEIHSMQGRTVTTRHGVTRKEAQK